LQAVQVQGSSWQDNVGMGINRDGGAGALAIRRAGSVVLSSSVFTNNTAERASGGAVSCVQCGQQVFRGLTFTGNTALRGSGGALHQNSSSSSTQLQRVVFEANRASANGGGLATYGMNATSCTAYIPECHTLLEGCAFIGNKAGVGQFTAGGGGGGMYAEQLTSTWRAIIVANSTFVNNSAASQSMSSVQSMDVDSSGAGGAIGESGQQNIATFVYNTTFERNTAAYGGAITLIWGGGLLCRNCTFRYNSAWSHGGAVMVYRVATSAAIVSPASITQPQLCVANSSADSALAQRCTLLCMSVQASHRLLTMRGSL
jgi:predicted outer membrane repeat protein